jgi:hypothetical protein
MTAASVLIALGAGLFLVRRPWARRLVRHTGFLTNRALDPDRVAAWLGGTGLLLAALGGVLAGLGR